MKAIIPRTAAYLEVRSGCPPNERNMKYPTYIKNKITINPSKIAIVPTGIAVAIPKNYEIQIRPRSGLAAKKGISVLNTPGTIDSDYRGEIKIILINLSKKPFVVKSGDRVAQMIVCPIAKGKLKEVKNLPRTLRGKKGFGSTGK